MTQFSQLYFLIKVGIGNALPHMPVQETVTYSCCCLLLCFSSYSVVISSICTDFIRISFVPHSTLWGAKGKSSVETEAYRSQVTYPADTDWAVQKPCWNSGLLTVCSQGFPPRCMASYFRRRQEPSLVRQYLQWPQGGSVAQKGPLSSRCLRLPFLHQSLPVSVFTCLSFFSLSLFSALLLLPFFSLIYYGTEFFFYFLQSFRPLLLI